VFILASKKGTATQGMRSLVADVEESSEAFASHGMFVRCNFEVQYLRAAVAF